MTGDISQESEDSIQSGVTSRHFGYKPPLKLRLKHKILNIKNVIFYPFSVLITIFIRVSIASRADKIFQHFTANELSVIGSELSSNNKSLEPDILLKLSERLSSFKNFKPSSKSISPFKKQITIDEYTKIFNILSFLEKYLLLDFKKIPTMIHTEEEDGKSIIKARLTLGK